MLRPHRIFAHIIKWLSLCLLLTAALSPVLAITQKADSTKAGLSAPANVTINELAHSFAELNFQAPQLEFSAFLSQQDLSVLSKQKSKLKRLQEQIVQLNINESKLTLCENIQLADLHFNIKLAQERYHLLKSSSSKPLNYQGSFTSLNNSKEWYQHWLKSWLMSDISVETLVQYANQELADVETRRKAIALSTLPENKKIIPRTDKQQIIARFKQKERLVYQHLSNVINTEFNAEPIKIVESSLPKSFPAPGIYNDLTGEFIYHMHDEYFAEKKMDWLFLHEAVPGHHFQNRFAKAQSKCPAIMSVSQSTVFNEGWAAYVETLGSELGVFTDSSSVNYALDWQALRAVRVLLDIGIHYHNWTDEKAREVWQAYIPEQSAIMEREIQRIHQWPAQVITYVYGKKTVLNAIKNLTHIYPDKNLAEVRNHILALSNHSLNGLGLWIDKQKDLLVHNN